MTVDPRHERRIKLMQQLFAWSFSGSDLPAGDNLTAEDQAAVAQIVDQLPLIDQELQAAAPERPLAEINKVDLAILRLVVFESKNTKTPAKVLINEGVELAKEFGSESSARLVNGVLGKVLVVRE